MSYSLHEQPYSPDYGLSQRCRSSMTVLRSQVGYNDWQSTVSLPATANQCRLSAAPDRKLTADSADNSRYSRRTNVRVLMLDDSIVPFSVKRKEHASVLLQRVYYHLDLVEVDYFGLEYQNTHGIKFWLDPTRAMCRQIGLSCRDPLLCFCVKFYTPDPARLLDSYTRHLFALQIRRDLRQGLLQCHANTAALLVALVMQAECGNYSPRAENYLRSNRAVERLDEDLELKILETYRQLQGLDSEEAEFHLLETARRCELYGIEMHQVKDQENASLNLAVAHSGLAIFHHFCKINTFSWAKIRKLSFKRRRFIIKLHTDIIESPKDAIIFIFPTRNLCKNFWKKCVEHHGFYRCQATPKRSLCKHRVITKGSQFRFTGRTQKELVVYARNSLTKKRLLERSSSIRSTCSAAVDRASSGFSSISALVPADLNSERLYSSATSVASKSSSFLPKRPVKLLDHESVQTDSVSAYEQTTSTMHSSSRPDINRDMMFSARAHVRHPPRLVSRAGCPSPGSDASTTLTSSMHPLRVSRSSRSLSETTYESFSHARAEKRRADNYSETFSNNLSVQIDNCDINGLYFDVNNDLNNDNISHGSYDLLEQSVSGNNENNRNCTEISISYSEDEKKHEKLECLTLSAKRSDSALGDISLIPYNVPKITKLVLLPTETTGKIAFSSDSSIEKHLNGNYTLPRLSHNRNTCSISYIDSRQSCGTMLAEDKGEPGKYSTMPYSTKSKKKDEIDSCDVALDNIKNSTSILDNLKIFKPTAEDAISNKHNSLDNDDSILPFYENLPNIVSEKVSPEVKYDYPKFSKPLQSTISSNQSKNEGDKEDAFVNVNALSENCLQSLSLRSAEKSSINPHHFSVPPEPKTQNKDVIFNADNQHNTSLFDVGEEDAEIFQTYEMYINSSLPILSLNEIRSTLKRCNSLPGSCLRYLSIDPTESSDSDTEQSVILTLTAPPAKFTEDPEKLDSINNVNENENRESTSLISDTSCSENDTTLQYDTVPDDSEDIDLTASGEYVDKALPLPFTYDIVYQPTRALSRISERSTNSEIDSRLSTPTAEERALFRQLSSSSVNSKSITENENRSETPVQEESVSLKSSIPEPLPKVHVLPIKEQSPLTVFVNDISIKSESDSFSPTVSISSQRSCSFEAEKAHTTGADSDQDEERPNVEDLPGDED